jgi:hypothetical protein
LPYQGFLIAWEKEAMKQSNFGDLVVGTVDGPFEGDLPEIEEVSAEEWTARQSAYWQERDTLIGLSTTSTEVIEGDGGAIGDEYCWMHSPGGWCCSECRGA